mmetsp:Transcript_143070/g.259751  ORF Transcript_143070/g.259751 Transcript_143070/m.259751 type:complete len:470 (-) Transcript_143070:81-1490(-)
MMADNSEAQKRKLAEEAQQVDALAKRVAGMEAVPSPMQVDSNAPALQMRNEDFSPELLRIYYDRLFPFHQMFRWLSYRNDPKSSNKEVCKDFFLRREFTFVLAGDIYCRYQCFRDWEEYRKEVTSRQPVRMEIGAVYTHPPKNHQTVIKDAYKPLERELVFDIDMDDYDDIRTCCTGAKLCTKCWTFMKAAIKTLDRALREDFGFKHLLFVYSGRRGVHCWVSDKIARRLSNEQRSAVADYLSVVIPGKDRARAEIKMYGAEEEHPSLREATNICYKYFKDDPQGVLQGQEILRPRSGRHLDNILALLGSAEAEAVSKYIEAHPEASSLQIWQQIEKAHEERLSALMRASGSFAEKRQAKVLLKEIVLQYTYPRLDVNVSKQMNHLLKSPFVVHPKTGRVCVPINIDTVDQFNPLEVPTIGRLVDELNRSGDKGETSLKQYTHFFETKFVQPLEFETGKEMNLNGNLDF